MASVEEKVRSIIVDQLGVSEGEVTPAASFITEVMMSSDGVSSAKPALLMSGRQTADFETLFESEWLRLIGILSRVTGSQAVAETPRDVRVSKPVVSLPER